LIEVKNSKTYIYCLRINGLVPWRVKPSHTAGKIGAIPILGLNIVGVLRDAIIDPIECFDEFLKSGE
jgi:hypothetical protein